MMFEYPFDNGTDTAHEKNVFVSDKTKNWLKQNKIHTQYGMEIYHHNFIFTLINSRQLRKVKSHLQILQDYGVIYSFKIKHGEIHVTTTDD